MDDGAAPVTQSGAQNLADDDDDDNIARVRDDMDDDADALGPNVDEHMCVLQAFWIAQSQTDIRLRGAAARRAA